MVPPPRRAARTCSPSTCTRRSCAEERALLTALLDRIETQTVAGIDVLVAAVALAGRVDVSVSHLAHKLVDLTDAKALVLLVEMDDRVFAVTRSRVAGARRRRARRRRSAAAATRRPRPRPSRATLDEARARLLARLRAGRARAVRARDVMASPPRTVPPGRDRRRTRWSLCQRHGQSGILVVDADGALAGVVGREDLDTRDRARPLARAGQGDHGRPRPDRRRGRRRSPSCSGCSPARARAGSRSAATARVVGVVTRSDVLRALGERRAASDATPGASLARRARARSSGSRRVFDAVQAVSERVEGVYLVGGTVRDILLGERELRRRHRRRGRRDRARRARSREQLGGRVRAAREVRHGGRRLRRATSASTSSPRRTEFYDAPAALPTVEHASIREDLFRRDFTINAMAVSLKGADYGRLVDPFGGRRDLEAGAIRVLHNLSFIDDPTRIFRAIRYENRYGFRMERAHASGSRARASRWASSATSRRRGSRDELVALLEEGDVRHSILRLAELGADRAIHPHLAADEEAVELLGAPRRAARPATGSTSPTGASASRRWRGGCRRTRCSAGRSG